MADFLGPRLRDWAGGFVWGGLSLAFALMFVSLFVSSVRDARDPAELLTPHSASALDLNEYRKTLVDVEGFAVDCEQAVFDGEQLLAPGFASDDAAAMLLVEFKHGSDCRDASASMQGRFRAKANAPSMKLREQLELDEAGLTFVVVKPHVVEYWMLIGIAFFGLIGVFGVRSALNTRKQLIERWRRARGDVLDEPPAVAPDERNAPDPYRPGASGRLITERIGIAPAFLAKLRRTRTVQTVFAGFLVVAALSLAGWMGHDLYEHEHVWNNGELAPEATATGEVRRSVLIIARTKLDVTFLDQHGKLHRESASGLSLIVTGDDSKPPVVRYMPDEPERFAVSWLHEQLWGSIVLTVLFCGGLLAGGIAILVGSRRDRRPEQAAAIFEDPREALLQLLGAQTQLVNGQETGVSYHFHIVDSNLEYTHFVPTKQPAPLFLDPDGSVALALYHPRDPSYLLLLSEDLRELDAPPFSPGQLRGRFQGLKGPEV